MSLFKYNLKQPVFFFENSTIQKGYIVKQHFSREVKDFQLSATEDNLDVNHFYMVKLHDQPYLSKSFKEENLFASREEFFSRITESWDSINN